MKISIPLFFN